MMMDSIKNFRIKQMSPQLHVTDLERSIEFYTKKLGFKIEFRYEDFYAGIIKDGYSIHLKTGDPPIEQKKQHEDRDPIDILFSVEHIQDLYEELSGKSVLFIQPLRQMPYGNEFYIADPDGNVIAFLETAQ
jgi:catechol 2,3-dioxygenase-like lactoylglutathione lyase family enzyme